MNQQTKTILITIAAIIIAGASLAYGALTAQTPQKQSAPTATPIVKKLSLDDQLKAELPTISGVLIAAYPVVATDYTVTKSQLFGDGQWYGALLIYKGTDVANRDTLRVLMEKKANIWTLRTSPPEPLLSSKKYPDVPKNILQTINKPVSLP